MKPETVLEYGLITDEESRTALENLFIEIRRQKAQMPSGFGYTLTADDDSKEYADFSWIDKNLLMFTIDKMGSYERLVNSQNKYKCYLLTNSFDYVAFVKEVID